MKDFIFTLLAICFYIMPLNQATGAEKTLPQNSVEIAKGRSVGYNVGVSGKKVVGGIVFLHPQGKFPFDVKNTFANEELLNISIKLDGKEVNLLETHKLIFLLDGKLLKEVDLAKDEMTFKEFKEMFIEWGKSKMGSSKNPENTHAHRGAPH